MAVGIYGLSQAILQIPFSLLADRFSRKTACGLGPLAIGGAIAGLSGHHLWRDYWPCYRWAVQFRAVVAALLFSRCDA